MWPFKDQTEELYHTYEHELAKRDKRINYLEGRLRGVQHLGIIQGEEVMFAIQQPNGKFGKYYLPLVK